MIKPTHTCFDDCLEFIEGLVISGASKEMILEYTLVHAICLTPGAGEEFAHGWVEHDKTGLVWQLGLMNGSELKVPYAVERAQFYETFRPQRLTKYTPREALAENYRTNHYGPWVPEYKALCRQRIGAREFGPTDLRVYIPKAPRARDRERTAMKHGASAEGEAVVSYCRFGPAQRRLHV